jgi:hypothetical protein
MRSMRRVPAAFSLFVQTITCVCKQILANLGAYRALITSLSVYSTNSFWFLLSICGEDTWWNDTQKQTIYIFHNTHKYFFFLHHAHSYSIAWLLIKHSSKLRPTPCNHRLRWTLASFPASFTIYSFHPKLYVIPRILESQSILSLTKIIEEIIKIYDIKYIYYENIINEEPNDT